MGSIDPLSSTRKTVSYLASARRASSVRGSRSDEEGAGAGMWGGARGGGGRAAGGGWEEGLGLLEKERRLKRPMVLSGLADG